MGTRLLRRLGKNSAKRRALLKQVAKGDLTAVTERDPNGYDLTTFYRRDDAVATMKNGKEVYDYSDGKAVDF